jgi:hypothetical protein
MRSYKSVIMVRNTEIYISGEEKAFSSLHPDNKPQEL